jgi:hypothetical protein
MFDPDQADKKRREQECTSECKIVWAATLLVLIDRYGMGRHIFFFVRKDRLEEFGDDERRLSLLLAKDTMMMLKKAG